MTSVRNLLTLRTTDEATTHQWHPFVRSDTWLSVGLCDHYGPRCQIVRCLSLDLLVSQEYSALLENEMKWIGL